MLKDQIYATNKYCKCHSLDNQTLTVISICLTVSNFLPLTKPGRI